MSKYVDFKYLQGECLLECCKFSYFDLGIRRPTGLLVPIAQHGHGVQGGRGGDGGGLQLGRVQRPLQEQARTHSPPCHADYTRAAKDPSVFAIMEKAPIY